MSDGDTTSDYEISPKYAKTGRCCDLSWYVTGSNRISKSYLIGIVGHHAIAPAGKFFARFHREL